MLKIGQIVTYKCNKNEKELLNNNLETAPAIVTAVWSENCANMKVLADGIHNIWKTSVSRGEGENQFAE